MYIWQYYWLQGPLDDALRLASFPPADLNGNMQHGAQFGWEPTNGLLRHKELRSTRCMEQINSAIPQMSLDIHSHYLTVTWNHCVVYGTIISIAEFLIEVMYIRHVPFTLHLVHTLFHTSYLILYLTFDTPMTMKPCGAVSHKLPGFIWTTLRQAEACHLLQLLHPVFFF